MRPSNTSNDPKINEIVTRVKARTHDKTEIVTDHKIEFYVYLSRTRDVFMLSKFVKPKDLFWRFQFWQILVIKAFKMSIRPE